MEVPVEEYSGETGLSEVEDISTPENDDAALAEFKRQVDYLCEKMQDDPAIRDRIIAETYVNIANMETAIRSVFVMFQQEGMAGMFKGMFSRKKGKKNDGGTDGTDE
jgi:hypothetical protein